MLTGHVMKYAGAILTTWSVFNLITAHIVNNPSMAISAGLDTLLGPATYLLGE